VRVVEAYLAISAAAHILAGTYLTLRYKRIAWPARGGLSAWFAGARLFVTGAIITAFVVIHLLHFKFADEEPQGWPEGHSAQHRAAYDRVVAVLADPFEAAFYIVATSLVGLHLAWGWEKAVGKFAEQSPSVKPLVSPMRAVGQAVAAAATLALCAVVVAAHMQSL
jgi:hypothetical protein